MSTGISPRWRNGAVLLAAALGLLVTAKLALTLGGWGRQWWQHDLWTLWRDQQTFWGGTYPHASVSTQTGAVRTAYPPTSFPLFAPWLPPGLSWPMGRAWFAFCQVGALGALTWFAWRKGREVDARLGALLAATVLAVNGVRADLLFGNMGLITTALLLVALLALERGKISVATGAWLAALVKPQMGWLLALAFWRRGTWRAWSVAALMFGASGAAACAWTGVSFARAIGAGAGEEVAKWGAWGPLNNLAVWFGALGLSPHVALASGAVLAVGAGAWAMSRRGLRDDRLGQFAVLGLVNRVCVYHNYCDDVLLVFALVWLGRRAWLGNMMDRAWWLMLALSAWWPGAGSSGPLIKIALLAVWAGAAWRIALTADEPQRAG